MKTIIITGGAGFIGSNLILHFRKKYPQTTIVNVDLLTYASGENYLSEISPSDFYHFENIDIRNRQKVRDLIRHYKPCGIIHLAAETHVDNSIVGPEAFITTNIVGTFNLLEEARQLWGEFSGHTGYEGNRFHHVSTDEVYGALGETGLFTEESPYRPNSPYSASKAASDHLARSYYVTYKMPVVITNCSNNYGPNQHAEKLIPTIIRKALAHQKIPVYGQGKNIRDWLYVADHCEAIDLVFHQGRLGECYNVGGDNEWKNIDLVRKVCAILDQLAPVLDFSYENLISFVADRPGHDARYAIDASKIKKELGWTPSPHFDDTLKQTIMWYLKDKKRISKTVSAPSEHGWQVADKTGRLS